MAKTKGSRARRVLIWLVLLIVIGAAAFLLGPRVPVDTTISFDAASIGQDVEAYVEQSEAAIGDIRDGLEKQIVWAYPASKARTPLSIVYVHGFSASAGEVRPLPDIVAKELGANLFFTRLTGHGRSGAAMADSSIHAWVNDIAEAIEIGRRLGNKVVIIATSSGATLTTWALTQPELAQDVVAHISISANYGVQAAGADLLAGPWGLQIARFLVGHERGFEPTNAMHERFWTTRYPVEALLPMSASLKLARSAPVERVTIPALFIYSPNDKVIRSDLIEEMAGRWGGRADLFAVEKTGDPANHVIAGDVLSPETTDALAARIVDFVGSVE